MSAGDIPVQVSPTANYESDDSSSSSKSLFNRSCIPIVSSPQTNTQLISTLSEQIPSVEKVMNNERAFKLNSHVRHLEEKLNANFYHQQSELTKLHKIIVDLSNQFYQLRSVVNSPMHSPVSHSRPNSTHHRIDNDYIHKHLTTNYSRSPECIPQSNDTCISPPSHMKSFDCFEASNGVENFRHFQDVLSKTTAALERRDIENHLLKKELGELRGTRPLLGQNSSNASTPSLHITQSSPQPSRTSAFVPIVSSSQPPLATVPTNMLRTTSMMPFTMSLTNTLPNFNGKESEMPTKFITEFEIRATGLVGHNDDYLLRAVQQVLSDSALTWFVQIQQEQPINNWAQFKQLFLRRFRTPEKIELLRGRLRTLWQGDNESTADYFERLKALMSEIEPETSIDYIKRKFLQKLRKDIREKMPVGLTHCLSDLVQKAIEIETNIIQQKIDDKLRDVHKEDNIIKQKSTTINNLLNASRSNPSSVTTYNKQSVHDNYTNNYNEQPVQDNYTNNYNGQPAHDNYTNNSKYNTNQHDYFNNKYSRTFTNSTRSPARATQVQNDSSISQPIFNRNVTTKTDRRNNNQWCSFCSSKSHTWFHCYSNPNGPNYQPERYQDVQHYQQQQPGQQFTSSPDSTQQQYSDRKHHHQPPNRNVLIDQHQQQHYEQPSSSSYLTSQRSSMPENFRGSRY